MTRLELRATLDRLDLSAAEAGHLLGVHRATVYRWLDGSMSVPIVVELLLCLMVRRGISFLLDILCEQSVSGAKQADTLVGSMAQILSPASAGRPPRGCGGASRRCAAIMRGTEMTKTTSRVNAKPRPGTKSRSKAKRARPAIDQKSNSPIRPLPRWASILARIHSTSSASIDVARSCCGRSGPAARSKRGLPTCRRA